MRALPARRIASSALCATLLLGIAGPAAMAADSVSAGGRTIHAAAPVPSADALPAQVQSLGDIAGVLTPVTDLLNAALKADNGQLFADDAAKLSQAVKDAIAKVTAAAPVAPPVALPTTATTTPTTTTPTTPTTTTPTTTTASTTSTATTEPTTPTTTTEPTTPALTKSAERQDDGKAPSAKGSRAEAPENLKGDALAALQTAVDTLVKAGTSGDATQVVPAATAVVTSLVNFVATVLGGGLPAANLPGLSSLTSTLPTSTVTSTLPTDSVTSAVPVSGLLPTS